MIITETKDIDKIKHVLCDPEIYDRIADDGAPALEDFEPIPPCDGVYYLTDENNIGIVFFHWKNHITLEGHVQILKAHRNDAMEFSKKALQWAWDNTQAMKIVVTIPEIYKDVLKFVEKHGFVYEGLSKGSYLKNSVLYSLVYMGLSR
tara:strand:- start:4714 stop:5157 length:444 start_codon:yes stop_codon:yes gene_type:complete